MYLLGAVTISIGALVAIMYVPTFQGIFHTSAINFGQWMIIVFFSGIISLINSVYILLSHKH
ncbi:hypothetical protein SDC9_100561 [bioreactor metagenome]|uniref:Cation-transporting P-type ATPase C-terminal domain-containing protein n=1 Tax=bioreactor metagenome TaxID=1076179 RepID=A0A645AKP1_9ZZZZ